MVIWGGGGDGDNSINSIGVTESEVTMFLFWGGHQLNWICVCQFLYSNMYLVIWHNFEFIQLYLDKISL